MVNRKMPRIQEVVIPLLRASLPDVDVGSWVDDVDYRTFPMLNVRRLGGLPIDVELLDKPTIELTAFGDESLEDTEDLYLDARTVLYRAVQSQTLTEKGYLHSYFETMGPTQFDSPFDDTWRIQGIIQLGVRPRRGL